MYKKIDEGKNNKAKTHAYIVLGVVLGIFLFSLIYQSSIIRGSESDSEIYFDSEPSPVYSLVPLETIDSTTSDDPKFSLENELFFRKDADSVIFIEDISVDVISVKVEMKRKSTGEVFSLFSYSPTPEPSPSPFPTEDYFFSYYIPIYINSGLLNNGENYVFSFKIRDINGEIYTEEKKVIAKLFVSSSEEPGEYGHSPPSSLTPVPTTPNTTTTPATEPNPYCIVENLTLRKCTDRFNIANADGQRGDNFVELVPGAVYDEDFASIDELIREIEAKGKGDGKCVDWDSERCFMIIGVVRANGTDEDKNGVPDSVEKLCKEGQEAQATITVTYINPRTFRTETLRRCLGKETGTGFIEPKSSDARCFEHPDTVKKCPDHNSHSGSYACDDYHAPKFAKALVENKTCYHKYHKKAERSDDRYLVIWYDNPSPTKLLQNSKADMNMRFHSYLWSNNCSEHKNKCFEIKYVYERYEGEIKNIYNSFEEKECEFEKT